MALLEIRTFPDPVLLKRAEPVIEFNESLAQLARDMGETMYANDGVGLAAPQVGLSLRFIVLDVESGEERGKRLLALANPEIVESDGDLEWEEGCLSLPGLSIKTKRRSKVRVRAFSPVGEPLEIVAEGLFAVALQHEIDHLEGTVLIDKVSGWKKASVLRSYYRKNPKTVGNAK